MSERKRETWRLIERAGALLYETLFGRPCAVEETRPTSFALSLAKEEIWRRLYADLT